MSLPIIIIFAACTIAIGTFSWRISLKDRRYHGISRFLSFECILLLLLLNYPVWFKNPFSTVQIVSWIFLLLSIYAAIAGFYSLYSEGKPADQMEETTHLITTGIYRYIRHPLYLSLIALGSGIMLKEPGYFQITLGMINFISLIITAKVEEREMIKRFGNKYAEYIQQTKMFIPFVF